jgi:hypothetical protein
MCTEPTCPYHSGIGFSTYANLRKHVRDYHQQGKASGPPPVFNVQTGGPSSQAQQQEGQAAQVSQPQSAKANPVMPMIRPQQIDSLPHLDASQKQAYTQGLMNLWNLFDNNPEGSQAKIDAKAKIQNASRKIMQQLGAGQRNSSNAAPQQAQQAQRPPQAQQAGNQGVQTSGVQQGAMQGQQNPQQMQQQQQGGQDQVAQLQANVKQMVQNLVVFPEPTTANSQQFEQYKLTFQQGLGTSILKRERARQEQIRLESLETQMKSQGRSLSNEMANRLNGARAACAEAQRAVTALEQRNEQNKDLYNQKQARNKKMQQARQQDQQMKNQQPAANQQVNGAQAEAMQRTNSQQAWRNVGQGDVRTEQQQQQQSPETLQFVRQQQQQQIRIPQVGTPVQQQQISSPAAATATAAGSSSAGKNTLKRHSA